MSRPHLTELSKSQRAAILDTAPRVLVSAGAGSGKTGLLVAFFIHSLIDEGIPPQDLVAVTFTRKAAAELCGRVRAGLIEVGRDDLAQAVDMSVIGTIHSLCGRLLRHHALQGEVDPCFSVIEAGATAILKQEACTAAWDLEVAEADDVRLGVLATHTHVLKEELVSLYDRLRAVGQDRPRLVLPPASSIREAGGRLAGAVEVALREAGRLPRKSKTLEEDLHRLSSCLRFLEDVADPPAPSSSLRPADVLSRSAEFFPTRRSKAAEAWFGPVRDALTVYRCSVAWEIAAPLVEAANGLLARFHDLYASAKRERGVLDFADLELRALALIRRSGAAGAGLLSPATRVMIDEFQDTNELQCSIVENLGAARLLMVGDDKQSIYRFRGADVLVFSRREAQLAGMREAAGFGAREVGLHRLTHNYRSSEQILSFVNRLFGGPGFFGSGFTPLVHSRRKDADCRCGTVAVDVLVVDRKDGDTAGSDIASIPEAEARVVGRKIRDLLDDEGWEPRDIVVLTPAMTYSTVLYSCLSQYGVEAYVVRGRGFYSREEVYDIRALLRVLINPHDDLALATVLRSPLVGLSDDALYLLGTHARRAGASLWDGIAGRSAALVAASDGEALDRFTAVLASVRPQIGRPGLARLIDDLISELGYDLCVLMSRGGERRFANIRKLMRLAEDFESLHGPDPAGFAAAIQGLDELGDSEGNAPTLSEGENVVRVMTVHQAKGLEFPVVVLTGLGSAVRGQDSSTFEVANDGRIAVVLKGTRRATYEEHDLCIGPGAQIAEDNEEHERLEDIRLQYVAMTRAEDRLVLVGAKPKKGELDDRRISRILAGLGLSSFPAQGESVLLPDAAATVSCVASTVPSWVDTVRAGRDRASTVATGVEVPDLGTYRFFSMERLRDPVVPTRLSFSALDLFRRCPRRFYLERVLGLRLGESVPDGVLSRRSTFLDESDGRYAAVEAGIRLDEEEDESGREVGLLVHRLLERLPLDNPPPDAQALRMSAAESDYAGRLQPHLLDRAVELTRAFWRSPVGSVRGIGAAEKEVQFHFARSGIVVNGVMDLVHKDDSSWLIVDYKTNSLGRRSPAKAAEGYHLQAHTYSLAALYAGAECVRMEFVFLERPEVPVVFSFTGGDRGALEMSLDEMLQKIVGGNYPASFGSGCNRCQAVAVCGALEAGA